MNILTVNLARATYLGAVRHMGNHHSLIWFNQERERESGKWAERVTVSVTQQNGAQCYFLINERPGEVSCPGPLMTSHVKII